MRLVQTKNGGLGNGGSEAADEKRRGEEQRGERGERMSE